MRRIRSDAANALARLRLKDGNEQLRKLLTTIPIRTFAPMPHACSARRKIKIHSMRCSRAPPPIPIRACASAASGHWLHSKIPAPRNLLFKRSIADTNEVLEIATTLGRVLAQKDDEAAINWLLKASEKLNHTAPEIQIALVRIAPPNYLSYLEQQTNPMNWRTAAAMAAGLGEVAALPDTVKGKPELCRARRIAAAQTARLRKFRPGDSGCAQRTRRVQTKRSDTGSDRTLAKTRRDRSWHRRGSPRRSATVRRN